MRDISRFANWLAWKALIWGSIIYCFYHFPAIAPFLVIALICSGW